MKTIEDVISQLEAVEASIDDLLFDALKEQLSSDDAESAKELEKRLAKARRSVAKATYSLRGLDFDSSGD